MMSLCKYKIIFNKTQIYRLFDDEWVLNNEKLYNNTQLVLFFPSDWLIAKRCIKIGQRALKISILWKPAEKECFWPPAGIYLFIAVTLKYTFT